MVTTNVKSFYEKCSVKNKVVTRMIPVEGDDSQLASDNERDEAYNPPVESDDSSTDDNESNLRTTSTSLSKTKNTKVKRRLLFKTAKDYNPHEENAGLGMLPGLAQSWIVTVLCTLPFMANHRTGRDEVGDRHTRGLPQLRPT